ncbi:hypothetical protein V7S43_006613 [Phytophthora oleae]|uniref:Uncharacterized protein n=1 Tax=Phytophthora oleae TaxID=2107226 RepID=A0ABD3FSB9_9STRA
MSHFYRHDDAPARQRSPKRNPFHAMDSPGKKQTTNHDSDQNLLEMLSSTVACLKQKNMDLEALGCMEQSLWLKRRMFGVDSSAVQKTLSEVVLSYNSVAMQYLSQGQFDQCLAMLRKAEAITGPGNFKRCQALQILTFNNIGCCYRKLGKLKSALKYLKEAAQIGSGSAHVKNLSITHLNLCAIQSQLGRHDLALEHAQAAIFHTQEELVSLEDGAGERDEDLDSRDQDALDPKTREEKMISLAVAYHNLAVELEFNGRGEASLQWYKKALQLVWKYRETNEALCESFKKIFLDAKKKQQTANIRHNGIPASVTGRRPLNTRPRSAHPSSRSRNEVGDVSYSSTVASHCYKTTKPSTAGLRYGTAARGKPQRPVSATTRPRPVSAKPTTRNYRNASRGSRDSAEGTFELHWKKLEKEHALDDFPAPTKKESKTRRPQSAGVRRNKIPERKQKLQGQLYFTAQDEDFIGNDEDYGVINDDGDTDDGFDAYPDRSRNNRQENGWTKNPKNQRPVGRRHRRALDDSRSQLSMDSNETISDSEAGTAGYIGDDDTDPDLPAQRVCHLEYLRRMKKLAESIKDDLNGVGIRPPTVDLSVNYSKSPTRTDGANTECGSRVSTPRSTTSKLRDRIEQARRDSGGNSPQVEAKASGIPTVKKEIDEGVEIQEDVHVFDSEVVARNFELKLFREAAGCRLQAFFRGERCRIEVKQLRQVKQEYDAAKLIQRQVRRYLEAQHENLRLEEERFQLELQREEVEDIAACLIQGLCRRVLGRNVAKSPEEDTSPVPMSRQFSIADVALGAAVKKSGGSSQGRPDYHLNAAATVPRINLSRLQEPEPPRRSFTESSIPLGVKATQQSSRSDDEVCHVSPRPTRSSREKLPTTPVRTSRSTGSQQSTTSTPRSINDTRQQHTAAIRIQASIKSYVVRRRIAVENACALTRIYIERRHFNVALDHALAMEQSFLEELSAIKIQALVRGRQSRLLTECTKAGVLTAVDTIQRSFRLHRQNIQRAVDEGVRSIAARTIQQVFRDYEGRRAAIHQAAIDNELLGVIEIAASTIQSFWRSFFIARDHSFEEIEAATCIQSLGRGHLVRKSLKSLHGSSGGLSKQSSAFSMSSSAEKLLEEENMTSARRGINYSFLPPSIRELYLSRDQVPTLNNQINPQELAELGLTFADFLRELETCTEFAVASSALEAMQVLVETSPESTKTLANVVKAAQTLDRRLHEGFWNEAMETAGIALLHTFRNLLDG